MTPKTERFEMRLEPSVLERVDYWRNRQPDLPSRAEAIRRLVETSLAEPRVPDFQLSKSERLMTWLLAEILELQKGHDEDTVKLIKETILGGHFWALEWEMMGVMHDHADKRERVKLVVDIMDMWSFIERAFNGFSKATQAHIEKEVGPLGKNPKFTGFDGNYEAEYMGIARFLVQQLGRFQDFKNRNLNSHVPVVARYGDMVALFEPMRSKLVGKGLSPDDVIKLLKVE